MNRERSTRTELLELIIYCGVMWAATHPDRVSDLRDDLAGRYRAVSAQVSHRLAVWETLAQIRSLPET